MKELSLHLLDIVKNSTAAGAALVEVSLTEAEDRTLTIVIADNGAGMSPETLSSVSDPFTTSRTTRKVGLGIPLYRMAAEQTGGSVKLESALGVGTTVTAVFHLDHLDCAPLGDLPGAVATIIQGNPRTDFRFSHAAPRGSYCLDTREMRELLGPDVPLDAPEVFTWVTGYLQEQEDALNDPTHFPAYGAGI